MSTRHNSTYFLLGFGTALTVVWVVQNYVSSSSSSSSSSQKQRTDSQKTNERPQQRDIKKKTLMDSPDLDQRLIRKAEAVIQFRTSRITVVIERCTNDHNYSAILRTAEALGIQNVWLIDPPPPPTVTFVDDDINNDSNNKNSTQDNNHNLQNGSSTNQDEDRMAVVTTTTTATATAAVTTSLQDRVGGKPVGKGIVTEHELQQRALHHLYAQHAQEWLTVREFPTTTDCLRELKRTGHQVWVTDLSQQAVCLTKEGLSSSLSTNDDQDDDDVRCANSFSLPPKLAIVFGTEAVGCSDELLQAADKRVYLPLYGFADSLNLSVATALVLHQLFVLDPSVVGDISEDERRALRQAWFTKLCRQRLLTPKQKRQRARLLASIRQCEKIQAKLDANKAVQPGELDKLKLWDEWKRQLKEFDETVLFKDDNNKDVNDNNDNNKTSNIDTKASVLQQAIQDLVDSPPSPLTDLRRADVHRVCFVGRNTKARNKDHWQNMPATSNYANANAELKNTSSNFFRSRVQQAAAALSAVSPTKLG